MKKIKTIGELRGLVSKQLFWSSIGILLFSGITLITGGFKDTEGFHEIAPFLAILVPINAMYIGTTFKYIGTLISSQVKGEKNTTNDFEFNISPSFKWIFYIIPVHFMILIILISSKAWLGLISFETMSQAFTGVESLFGVYIGYFVSAVFGVESPKNS